jgi:hypothetical protein
MRRLLVGRAHPRGGALLGSHWASRGPVRCGCWVLTVLGSWEYGNWENLIVTRPDACTEYVRCMYSTLHHVCSQDDFVARSMYTLYVGRWTVSFGPPLWGCKNSQERRRGEISPLCAKLLTVRSALLPPYSGHTRVVLCCI